MSAPIALMPAPVAGSSSGSHCCNKIINEEEIIQVQVINEISNVDNVANNYLIIYNL